MSYTYRKLSCSYLGVRQNFMKDQIQIELRLLIDQINEYHKRFGENDIRSSFLDGYFQILRTYYCAYFQFESDDILEKYYEIYQKRDFNKKDILIHIQGHKNLLNSSLIINCWSNFELFITLFCSAVLPETKLKELLEIDYQRLIKILKSYTISNETDDKLKKYIKNHLAHTPIINKYGKLFKLINDYPANRDKKNDREFLEFFGSLRNCIHSNYIYYGGEDKAFEFNSEVYTFKFGKLLNHNPSKEDSIFHLTQNLKDIFIVFVNGINYNSEIYDPSVELIH